ncbi:MAG TPA: NIPSNAP family protein [Stellaceae bacterium]|nr:NIPSNAP family protein [Stellaceae bacterium]
MILEHRCYTLKIGTTPKATDAFASRLPARAKVSPLAGFFQSEIGLLNQIHMMWPYANLAERERLRDVKVEGWPPPLGEFGIEYDVQVLNAAPFSPKIEPRKLGELYEIRTYNYQGGSIPHVIEAWGGRIEERQKYSPLVFAGYSEFGTQHVWVHIWAYQDWNHRARVRHETHEKGVWPPRGNPAAVLLRQRNALVLPASFSPWH